jgi:type I restriction enzyme S subunit
MEIEIPEDYSKTEMGILPKQWKVYSIGELVENSIIEKPLDGNHGNIHPKSTDFVDEGIPFIMANSVFEGVVDLKNCSFIRKEQADNLQKGFSITGDVLLTHKGTVGNVAIVGQISTPYIMLTPQVTYYRVKDKSRITNTFIRYYFESAKFQAILQSLSGGGTRAYIGITKQRQLPFILPPLPEQKAIAQPLSDVDAAIAELDRLITKKRNIKQGVTQQLLTGKKRLPGFNGNWKAREFCDFAYLSKERLDPQRVEKSYRCIELEHIEQGTSRLLGFCDSINQLSQKAVFKKGDVLFGKLRPYLKKFYLSEFDGICSTEIWAIRAKKNILPEFMFLIVQTDIFWEEANNKATGTKMPRANWQDIAHLEFLLPSPTEQKAIAQVLTDMDAEIEALEQKRDKYKAIKQGMMQELLTGRTRLV